MTGERPEAHEFRPGWCLAPAATLAKWLRVNETTVRKVAESAVGGLPPSVSVSAGEAASAIQAVLDREPLTPGRASILARGTGVSKRFWLALESNYRAGLAAGLTDTTPEDTDG